ncbi:MAG TPA: dihydrofolate reductase family protein [Burkholderiaceae bacterium]|nr:dihydrofolate reductase family protein [Burkholderiaceae bacterium]
MSAPLFAQISVSLDGYIEDESKSIDWMTEDGSVDALHTRVLSEIDGMIFGRKAHAAIADFWMQAARSHGGSDDLRQQTACMTALPKYVLTHGKENTGWVNSHSITLDAVPRILREAARPIAVFAGAGAIQALLERGWVQELRLIRYPIALAGGTPLFAHRHEFRTFDTQPFASGAVLERFQVRAGSA